MTVMQARRANQSRHARAAIGSVLLCIVGGISLLIAVFTWTIACQAGSQLSCRSGSPSFELVFQFALAAAGFVAGFVVRYFLNRRASAPARVAVAVNLLLLAAWVVFVDAATHGWDDLQFWTILLTIALILAPLALIAAVLIAAVLRRTR